MRETFSRRQFLARSVTAAIAVSTATLPRFSKAEASRLQTRVLGAKVSFVEQSFLRPLILSSGTISKITEAVVEVSVRVNGVESIGRGSMYLSDLWAWPDPALTHADRDARLRELVEEFARRLDSLCGGEAAHPLELGLRLHESVCREKSPPVLARAMCASPFDAAIHDAAGIGLGMSAFDFYREPTPIPSADRHFRGSSAVAAIAKILRAPKRELRAWYVVGKNDSMEAVVGPWIRDRGYHCFKIKLLGKDNAYDVGRTVEVFREARRLGAQNIQLDVDTNEANPDAASVIDYSQRLRVADADAYEALLYFEQPTGRDITAHKFDWRAVTRFKPVMLDEGLTSLELMHEALAQGWSGFALKTCKGHSFALTAAAFARENNLLLSLQDLTNPGLSMIHSAWFAAHVPMLNDVELNSPQFTPAANQAWLPRLADLFEPTGGAHRLPEKVPVGLGSSM